MDHDRDIDFEKVFDGLVPWSVDEFMAFHEYEAELAKTPRDDWDQRPREVDFADVAEVPNQDLDAVRRSLQNALLSWPGCGFVLRKLSLEQSPRRHEVRHVQHELVFRDGDLDLFPL